jgi:hypothetical protein
MVTDRRYKYGDPISQHAILPGTAFSAFDRSPGTGRASQSRIADPRAKPFSVRTLAGSD